MKEMSVTEQRYKAVLAVLGDGRTVGEVASEWGVCRQTMQRWLARHEGDGRASARNRDPGGQSPTSPPLGTSTLHQRPQRADVGPLTRPSRPRTGHTNPP